MATSISDICARIGIPAPARAPHNNASKRADYKDYFNDKNKALFDRIYRDDIAQFGYEF